MTSRSQSFGAIAEQYNSYRPGPPAEVADWITPRLCHVAVDIGAGTGALTKHLVTRAQEVYAVEPDERMASVLIRLGGNVQHLHSTAEKISLANSSVDLVAGSSMWHWVDPQVAGAEIARILRPGGTFALVGNGADRSIPWVAEILGRHQNEMSANSIRDRWQSRFSLPETLPFAGMEANVINWTLPVTPEFILNMACTYSAVIAMDEADRQKFRGEIAASLATLEETRGKELIDLPMRCYCMRTTRL
jgi:SAM-dependent methyltransferase